MANDKLNINQITVEDLEHYTILKLVHKLVGKTNELVYSNNDIYDKLEYLLKDGLSKEVVKTLTDWLNDGTLSDVITEEVLVEIDSRIDETNSQLSEIKNMKVNVKDYGALGDGLSDDTQAIIQAKEVALRENKTLFFPKGVYCYTDLGNLAYTDFKILGSGHKEVILKCISTVQNHKAIYFDAYTYGANSPILHGISFKNIIVNGNVNTKHIIYCQGVSNMEWKNIYYRECAADGVGLQLNGCHTSNFYNVSCGHNYTGHTNLNPTIGIEFDWGIRGGIVEGRSTNNTFQNCYVENCITGINMKNGDQNIFQSCASQANTGVGVMIRPDTRMTIFIGCGFESNQGLIDGKTTDIYDDGRLTTYINCYTDKLLLLAGQQNTIMGGNYRSIHCTGRHNIINSVRVNYGGTDEGGLIDNGVATKILSVLDIKESVNDYIYPQLRPRTPITVESSPFTFTNNTGKLIEVIVQSGTLIRVQRQREGDNPFLCNHSVPNSYLLAPTESLIFTWDGDNNAPGLSYIVYNGF